MRSCQAWLVTGITCRNILQAPYWWSSDICIGPSGKPMKLVFIVQDTRGEDSRAVQPRASFLSLGAARKGQNMSSPEEALATAPAAIRFLSLWFCAGNFTPWKKFPSNNINCLYSPLVPLFKWIKAGINLFYRVYADGTINSNIYFRHSSQTFYAC